MEPSEEKKLVAEAQSAEAVDAAAIHAEAVEKARMAQVQAMIEESERRMTGALQTALKEVFSEGERNKRYIDVTRVPLICQNITGIHDSLKKLEDKMETKLVSREAFDAQKEKVDGLQDNQKWVVRSIIGIVIAAVMALIITTQ